jgi:predicted Zn-dependent protease with MMP-like domain
MTAAEFDALVHKVESSAATTDLEGAAIGEAEEREFAAIVRDAIEELPAFVKDELARNVAVIIAEDGALPERYGHAGIGGLFGLYVGWTASVPNEGARIILFRDTLTRRFEDPDQLREQVVITLRHEIAHHFGADESRIEELGL